MKYLLLIYSAKENGPKENTPEYGEMFKGYMSLEKELSVSKIRLAGEALQDKETATTLRIRDGKTLLTDGPFAETKEVLGGFYMLDCKDLDEALSVAAKIPTAEYGSIEVRPIQEIEFPED